MSTGSVEPALDKSWALAGLGEPLEQWALWGTGIDAA